MTRATPPDFPGPAAPAPDPAPALSTAGRLLVTTFGLGFFRPASGTWGSMPTVALAGALILVRQAPVWNTPAWWTYHGALAAVLIVFSAACIRFGPAAEARFGKKDPGQIVADETAGQALPLMFLPAAAFTPLTHLGLTLAVAFLAFRLCDIIKPWPARGLQRLPAGWGILVDDLVAGLQAALITQLFTRLLF